MAKDPAILFYTADFRQGTMLLSDSQVGQYIRLLCDQHQNGHLPEEHMLNVCKSYDSPVLKKFIKDEFGLYFNERMDIEITKRKEYCESRRKVRQEYLDKKKEEELRTSQHTLKHTSQRMDNGNGNDNINILKSLFESFRKKYPGTKRGLDTEFDNLKKKHSDWKDIVKILDQNLNRQLEERKKLTFVPEWPNLQTYINQRRWEQEYIGEQQSKMVRRVNYAL